MPLAVAPLPFKPPRLVGLSERLLASHYENNYGGALRRLNAIDDRLSLVDWRTLPGYEINGLQREALIAENSVVLHEVYFESLGGADGLGSPAGPPSENFAAAIARDFGSLARWNEHFCAMGKAMGGGSGWVVLAWSPRRNRLINCWASDHAHTLADSAPIIALDMYEHAYHLDFGADAGSYVEAFMANLNWDRPERRFRRAVGLDPAQSGAAGEEGPLPPEALRQRLADGEDILVLDTCLAEDMANRRDKIPGALIRPPETIADWVGDLPRDRPIVAYCVYGFQVSGDTVARLRDQGFDARRLAGGIAAWHAMGGESVPLD